MTEEQERPSDEELRAAFEEQLRRIRVEDVLVQTVVTLVNLAGRRMGLPGPEGERDETPDLAQARLAIEAARALMPHLPAEPQSALRDALSQIQLAYAKAQLVDHDALAAYQESGDVLMAERTLKDAFETDARPLVAEARRRSGAALDPVAAFRASGYRAAKAHERVGGVIEARGL